MTMRVTKPVTVQLVGGLGNQLFGYFAGRYVAKRLGAELLVDISQFDKGITAHGSSIESFVLSERIVNLKQETRFAILLTQNLLNFASSKVPAFTGAAELLTRIHTSRPIGIDPRISKIKPGMLMRGYYQSYVYVQDVVSESTFDLVLSQPSEWFKSMVTDAARAKPIMVHVRRGDYAKAENKDFGMLDARYYENAVSRARKKLGDAHRPIWIFSDDIPLVRTELSELFSDASFVVPPDESNAAESMILMSKGAANVISNSTFSWWAAILNSGSVVVAPSKWFKNMNDPEGLIPPEWLTQESEWK